METRKTEWPEQGSKLEQVIAFLYVVSGIWLLYTPAIIYEVTKEKYLNLQARKKIVPSPNEPNPRSLSHVSSNSDSIVGDRSISIS